MREHVAAGLSRLKARAAIAALTRVTRNRREDDGLRDACRDALVTIAQTYPAGDPTRARIQRDIARDRD